MNLEKVIRDVQDFPKEGILFKDITTILHDKDALKFALDEYARKLEGVQYDYIVGPESRGFIFGVPLAYNQGKGFIPVRKEGKLPYKTLKESYDLEYGSATIEMHIDAIKKGDKVVIVDDLLATGGTCRAMIRLIEKAGGEVVKVVFLIELAFLKGRSVLKGYDVQSLITYD